MTCEVGPPRLPAWRTAPQHPSAARATGRPRCRAVRGPARRPHGGRGLEARRRPSSRASHRRFSFPVLGTIRPVESRPEIRYTRTEDGTHIGYQVEGGGGLDLLELSLFVSSIAVPMDDPLVRRWERRLGALGRVIRYDRRGVGLSDPVALDELTIEGWMYDALAVLDALEVDRAVLLGRELVSGLTALLM